MIDMVQSEPARIISGRATTTLIIDEHSCSFSSAGFDPETVKGITRVEGAI